MSYTCLNYHFISFCHKNLGEKKEMFHCFNYRYLIFFFFCHFDIVFPKLEARICYFWTL